MSPKLLAIALVVALALPATAAAGRHSNDSTLLVAFKPGAPSSAAEHALAAAGASRIGSVRGLGVAIVQASAPAAALAALKHNPNVAYAEANSVLQPQDVLPGDPAFPQQYAIAGGAWGWTKTHTTQAWDVTQGSSSVVVAVLDTGLKTQGLSDFNGQTVSGWNVLAGTSDTSTNAGVHGTYVAGVVGLALGNGAGNVGYCPGCRIMPVQVGTDSGAYVSDMASGITWATDRGAKVINLSWAGSSPSTTLDSAVAYARSKGVVVVAAAGNSNCDCTNYPAASPGVLGVAGTDSSDNKQPDSNYGSWVKLAAPESNLTAWPTLNGAPGYAQVGGTSLAAPVVAGIAGLLFSADSGATGAQVEQALESSAVPAGLTVAYGRVDALAALNALGYSDPQTAQAPANTSAPQILFETNGDYNSAPLGAAAPQAGQVLLRGQGTWTGSAPLTIGSVQWQRCDATGANCTIAATAAKYTVQSTDAGFTFRLAVTVKNGVGSTTVTTAASAAVGGSSATAAPANMSPPAITGTAQAGQTLTATTGTWSGSPTSYAYQWQRCSTCTAIAGATASSYTVQTADVGSTLTVSVTATNSGGSATATSTPTAAVTSAPVAPPSNTAPPTISGTARAGQTLTATTGTWSGSPTSYAYQWQRCTTTCAAIAGATSSSYTAQTTDVGATLAVAVAATNSGGSSTATSAPTAAVTSAPAPQPSTQTLTFSGSLTPAHTTQSFTVTAGTGPATAQLTFSKCPALSLTITAAGSTVASGTGPSGLTVTASLTAGSYTFTVSGGKCAFTLTVTTGT